MKTNFSLTGSMLPGWEPPFDAQIILRACDKLRKVKGMDISTGPGWINFQIKVGNGIYKCAEYREWVKEINDEFIAHISLKFSKVTI